MQPVTQTSRRLGSTPDRPSNQSGKQWIHYQTQPRFNREEMSGHQAKKSRKFCPIFVPNGVFDHFGTKLQELSDKDLRDFLTRKLGNAEGGTRTPTGCPIRPSNVRVYQFHHFGIGKRKIIKLAFTSSLAGWTALELLQTCHPAMPPGLLKLKLPAKLQGLRLLPERLLAKRLGLRLESVVSQARHHQLPCLLQSLASRKSMPIA